MLPYVLLTFGEVLVSATGLEFAYSQAPHAMKGVIMAFWYLAVTFGNLWVLLTNASVRNDAVISHIASTGLSENAFLMFFFAGFAFARRRGVRAVRAHLSDAGQLPERRMTTRRSPLILIVVTVPGVVAGIQQSEAARAADPVAAGDRPSQAVRPPGHARLHPCRLRRTCCST